MTDPRTEALEAAHRGLARTWIDFESGLATVPLIGRLLGGRLRLEDYRRLLLNLRQQVVEGSRWIARAASSLDAAHAELRSLFLRHAVAEHRDYLLLEQNYVAAGGDPALTATTPKNVGSEALSAWMFHAAGQPNPTGLLGAMFVIEGLGERLAAPWAEAAQRQLGLPDEAFTFLRYHGANDGDHLDMFDRALALAVATREAAEDVVRHARVTARLYRLQLEEIDHG
ncbi:MAG TPA: iron-containing redox enzyme family protein [Allosphingosinicella sp.]|nr:iron-containing redox enzyme family protein [Allosphingosinicella sp.]